MNILENIMEDNGLMIPSINESFCLDGLKNLLAQKTKEFKEFAIESNNTLINASESNNALINHNKYIQEFLIENEKEESEDNKNNKDFYRASASGKEVEEVEEEEDKKENSYLKISEEGEEETASNYNNEHLNKSKGGNSSEQEDKDEIKPISEGDDSESDRDSDAKNSSDNYSNSKNNNKNKNYVEDKLLDRTEHNPNNITTGNAKYLELIEMFTRLDKKKSHIEDDLNYAIMRIKEFKIDETRKNNLINDILKMKDKSTQKIDNLEGEINDVINKTIIQNNNNNESFLLKPLNSFMIIKEYKANNINDNEILAELKSDAEIKNFDLIFEGNSKKEKHNKEMIIENELNIQLNYDNKKDADKIFVCEENIINLNFIREEKHFQIEKEEIKIIKDISEDASSAINTSKISKKSFEESKEISFRIDNSNTLNNKIKIQSKEKKHNSIETGISIDFHCDSSNKDLLSSNDKLIHCNSNNSENIRRVSNTNTNSKFDLKKYQNLDTYTRKVNFSNVYNDDNIDLDLLKTTIFKARNGKNVKSLLKENYFTNQENAKSINSNKNINIIKGENTSTEINTNNSQDKVSQQNKINKNTNFNNMMNKNIEGECRNSLSNVLSNVVKNEEATPKLKTNFFKKYANLNNNHNFMFNGININCINSKNNSRNSSNMNSNIIYNNSNSYSNNNKLLLDKDLKIINNVSANTTNEKELSLSNLKFSTHINQEDEFITSTNPQTNNLLVNEFASSIDDDKNKVIEDLFSKLKEYSNKMPELNNLIETYKDKLNVKNPDPNANLANLLHNHFNDNNDFNLNTYEYNNININRFKELKRDKNEREDKNNSLEHKLKLINIDNLESNCPNFHYANNKSISSQKEINFSNQADDNPYSENKMNSSKDSRKTEEIISHLEMKAEKVFKNILYIIILLTLNFQLKRLVV